MLFTKTPAFSDHGEVAPHLMGGVAITQLTGAMLAEIAGMASPEELRGFFVAVGTRLAALQPARDLKRLDQLADRINGFWQALGWGHVSFELDDEGMDISHEGMPATLESDTANVWAKAAPAILEGAYDAWCREMGSNGRLHTFVRREGGGRIELRHGV
jgi:hypothetical protein